MKRMVILVIMIIGVPLQACAGSETPEPEDMETIQLKVQTLPYLSFAPLFIAYEEGYFTEQNIEIEFIEIDQASGFEAIPMLLEGQIDVIADSIHAGVINAMVAGQPIRVVSDRGFLDPDGCTYFGILARKDLMENGLELNAELIDSVAGPLRGTGMPIYFFDQYFAKVGLSFTDFSISEVPIFATIEAFGSSALDFYSTSEPWITINQNAGKADLWVAFEDEFPGAQFLGVMFGPTLLNDNPEAGKRFMTAFRKGVLTYLEGKTERNLEILAEYTGLEVGLLQQACWVQMTEDGHINFPSVESYIEWGIERTYLDGMLTEDEFFDSQFIDYANEQLGVVGQ